MNIINIIIGRCFKNPLLFTLKFIYKNVVPRHCQDCFFILLAAMLRLGAGSPVKIILKQSKNVVILYADGICASVSWRAYHFISQIWYGCIVCITFGNFLKQFFRLRAKVLYGQLPFLLFQNVLCIFYKCLFAFHTLPSFVYR